MQDELTRKMEQSAKESKMEFFKNTCYLGTIGTLITFCFTIFWKGIEQDEISPARATNIILYTILFISEIVVLWYFSLLL
jgi:hypothetical protein